ncbi:HAMP domain-containing sensor histidine kinase [Paenibacillus sp.]|uniref:sensor histidine kinase n=1 Tax=Paenibacillus sp. TaxID=58172 RepID=UPI002D2293AC|nr:HAMP domain-containing sensor histidine kinase [Paenibacillus sp.]HZG84217.1 HAMP domain-containing sensor histidine kinase [Paenibacillus sp.]
MVDRTRYRLTLVNTAVLLLILLAVNATVYAFAHHAIFSQVDRALRLKADELSAQPNPDFDSFLYDLGQLDRPVFQVIWFGGGRVSPPALTAMFPGETMKFYPEPGRTYQTIRVDGASFRAIVVDDFPAAISVNGQPMEYMQLVTSVSAEVDMLRRLRFVLIGCTLAGAVASLAGAWFLAGRALVPISRSWERQQRFVSDASHELRTPITIIQTSAELLLRHPHHTIEQDAKYVSNVMKEARRMKRLLEHLLTIARADSNQLQLEWRRMPLHGAAAELAEHMRALAEAKPVSLRFEAREPVVIEADEDRVVQLMTILLDNAIQYTPPGGCVELSIGKQEHWARIVVSDNGVGIAKEQLPFIFDRFYRADASRSRKDAGAGLGLSIAQWIVESHNGHIRVVSEPGKGTSVTVLLPLQRRGS